MNERTKTINLKDSATFFCFSRSRQACGGLTSKRATSLRQQDSRASRARQTSTAM